MREPNPHKSSFPFNSLYKSSPYNEWIQLVKTPTDLQDLLKTFHIIPKDWIEWVDEKVESAIQRGIIIQQPLNYRLSILWNGIILLQETKYICDVLENAIRQVIITHVNEHLITYKQLSQFIPDWLATLTKYEQLKGKIELENIAIPNFIIALTFYQLTETVARKWICLCKDPHIPGFGNYFRSDKNCRDFNLFRKNMEIIRHNRNAIAHSHKLFCKEEAQALYDVACQWLRPLEIDLTQKVLSYRNQRPKFLQDLLMINSPLKKSSR